jgi:hypothetical protein
LRNSTIAMAILNIAIKGRRAIMDDFNNFVAIPVGLRKKSWHEGARAYLEGKYMSDNPYDRDEPLDEQYDDNDHIQWEDGWYEQHMKRKNSTR